MSPQEAIVKAVLDMEKEGKPISTENKVKFRNCLEWLIDNEKDNKKLAWCYNLRGEVYSGMHKAVCVEE